MRRYTFYLSVALLAFGIGSFVVFKFYWITDEKPITIEPIKKTNIAKIEVASNFVGKEIELFKQRKNFKCQDRFLLAVWNHLQKNKDLKEVFDRGIQNKELFDCSEVIGIDKLADLNNDGIDEVIVSGKGWLNGINNSSIWIVRKIGKKYKVILEDSAADYQIKAASTNNFRDIFIKHHASCCSSYQTTYKFRKRKYQENKCLFVDYGTTGVAKITTCDEENARSEKKSHQNKISSNN